MATVFYDGMPNVNEKLNELYTAFAAGPYSAVPLSGGTMTGALFTPLLATDKLYVGYQGGAPQNVISIPGPETTKLLTMVSCGEFYVGAGTFGSSAATVMNLVRNVVTNRSINVPGTVNANGADYAEYMVKRADCAAVAPGQVVGIDGEGKITDRWNMAVTFAVKSTNPCIVGGDNWAAHLGQRPEGDQAEYDAALEAARQTVDRIAFAGQVPVNVQGAEPGDYIVPVADGAGIGALMVREDDLTFKQLLRAVGKVIAIEDDGRARIIVKVG